MARAAAAPLLIALALAAQAEEMPGVDNPAYAQSLYRIHCQGCHLPDGAGNPPRYIPNFRQELGLFLHSEEGRAYLLQVPGSAGAPIDDADLAAVSNWMLWQFSRQELPSGYQPYTADEVSALREVPMHDPNPRRQRILAAICAEVPQAASAAACQTAENSAAP